MEQRSNEVEDVVEISHGGGVGSHVFFSFGA